MSSPVGCQPDVLEYLCAGLPAGVAILGKVIGGIDQGALDVDHFHEPVSPRGLARAALAPASPTTEAAPASASTASPLSATTLSAPLTPSAATASAGLRGLTPASDLDEDVKVVPGGEAVVGFRRHRYPRLLRRR